MIETAVGLLLALLAFSPVLTFYIGFRMGRRERPVPPPPLPPPAPPPSALLTRTRTLVAIQPQEDSGELKRHRVYARLIKEFPDQPKRTLSRAIEDALGH